VPLIKRTVINTSVPHWDGREWEKFLAAAETMNPAVARSAIDAILSGVGQASDDFFREHEETSVDEIQRGLMQLWAIYEGLRGLWQIGVDSSHAS
jgi:hypothetical protein